MATSAAEPGIGILGGTFDPIHYGHLRLAWEALQGLALDHVRLIPCHVPPHRGDPAGAAHHRLAMVELACADTTGFVVDARELEKNSPSYSVETLQALRKQFGPERPLVFLMGMDAFCGFCNWHQWQEILELCHLWVGHRPGSQLPDIQHPAGLLLQERGATQGSLAWTPSGRIHVQETVALDISATYLRQQMQHGQSPRFLLPESVHRYIQQQRLYAPHPPAETHPTL
ncbi:Cytidylyltransferase [gamma proteobacterium HdN1]|nr:Cytidylyltransferase [gamma proteobacterium HdN1]